MTPPERPVIGFLTDFGLDGAAAVCRGVMLGICRDAQIVDISHTVRKFQIADGGRLLAFALPYLPTGVHVGVVDPGVGTPRRPIAIRTERGDVLIGPDNGLLPPAADALGGVREARVLENRDLWLPATSMTFHGRDVFAPVAAHLAVGDAAFEDVGGVLDPAELVRLPNPAASTAPGRIETVVTYVDSFGNIRVAGGRDEVASAFGRSADGIPLRVEVHPTAGGKPKVERTTLAPTFAAVPVGSPLVYLDSQGTLALADNQGNIAVRLGLQAGQRVVITRE